MLEPKYALVRQPSPLMPIACELTHMHRAPIDMDLAVHQHAHYAEALTNLGLLVTVLPPLDGHADCAFVEDTFILLPEIAIQCRLGAAPRLGEGASVASEFTNIEIALIEAPATIEGGDVLRIDRTLYVGVGTRTNEAGICALAKIAEPLGYVVVAVPTPSALHLKTACTALSPSVFLANRDWIEAKAFGDVQFVNVDPSEPFAGNTLTVGDTILLPAAHPRTAAKVEALGLKTELIDISEFTKAEAGLTCMSLLW